MERATNSSLILYTTEDGLTKIEATFDRDTVWLSIDQMADLFQRNKSTISRHIGNIYKEGELDKTATVAKFATVQMEGERQVERQIEYYNLDVIISVGYRVKSQRGGQFRMWATAILKEFMKKGGVLDDDRLKNLGGGNYFDELLARIRAVLRRTASRAELRSTPTAADIRLDEGALKVQVGGHSVALTGQECRLLKILLATPGELVSRDRLYREVFGRSPMPFERGLDMQISRLRKKLGRTDNGSERILAVRGEGYLYALEGRKEEEAS